MSPSSVVQFIFNIETALICKFTLKAAQKFDLTIGMNFPSAHKKNYDSITQM